MGNVSDMDVMHTPDGDVNMFPCLRCGAQTPNAYCQVCDTKVWRGPLVCVQCYLPMRPGSLGIYCSDMCRANGNAHADLNQPPVPRALPPNVLQAAQDLVYGDRAAAYGPAGPNHLNIAKMFNAWIDARYPEGAEGLDAYDSCVFNIMQKLSRFAHGLKDGKVHRDSLIDGAGYFGVMGKIDDERASP